MHYFIVYGIQNMDEKHTLLIMQTILTQECISSEEEDNTIREPPKTSLREYLYRLIGTNRELLIHAYYPTGYPHKSFVLSNPAKKEVVLKVLHSLPVTIEIIFKPLARTNYLYATGYLTRPMLRTTLLQM